MLCETIFDFIQCWNDEVHSIFHYLYTFDIASLPHCSFHHMDHYKSYAHAANGLAKHSIKLFFVRFGNYQHYWSYLHANQINIKLNQWRISGGFLLILLFLQGSNSVKNYTLYILPKLNETPSLHDCGKSMGWLSGKSIINF